jgi:hypothetical protein
MQPRRQLQDHAKVLSLTPREWVADDQRVLQGDRRQRQRQSVLGGFT